MTQASGKSTPDESKAGATAAGDRTSGAESRELFTEVSSLVAALAKALDLTETETSEAVERGEVSLSLERDGNRNPFVNARYRGVTARVYQGAIKREPDEAG